MPGDTVLVEDLGDHVTELILNRPDKLNAFNDELRRDFGEALDGCEHDLQVRVIIVKGAGRAFSVGADIEGGSSTHADTAEDDRTRMLRNTLDFFLRIWDYPKPVIAQIHGHCIGNATILAGCCDLAFIAEDAQLSWPALPIGGGMLSPFWAWRIGVHRAKEMSFQIGKRIGGREAVEMGFFNHAFPREELEAETRRVAARIARVPSDLLRIKKAANNQVLDSLGFKEAVRRGAVWNAVAHNTRAAEEGRARLKADGLKETVHYYTAE